MFKKKLTFLKKISLLQQDESDCGIAALASIVNWHGGTVDKEYLRHLSGTTVNGTTMLGLYQASQKIGFDAKGVKMDFEHLTSQVEPTILLVTTENNFLHYIVFYEKTISNEYIILDPSIGVKIISHLDLEKMWTNKMALLVSPNDTFELSEGKVKRKFQSFVDLLRPDLSILLVCIALGIISSLLSLSNAFFTQKLIDDFLPQKESGKVIIGLILLLIILLSCSFINSIRSRFILAQSKNFNERITIRFFEKLIYLPKTFFDSRKLGDLLTRLSDTQRIQKNINIIGGNLIIDLIICILSIGCLFFYSWQIGLISLITIPLFLFIVNRFSRKINTGYLQVMNSSSVVESNYIDTLTGIDVVREHNKQSYFKDITNIFFTDFQLKQFNLGLVNIKFNLYSDIIGVFTIISIIAVSSLLIINNNLKIGQMMAILTLSGALLPSIMRLGQINTYIQEIIVAHNRMLELNIFHDSITSTSLDDIFEFNQLILDQVSFNFNGSKTLFSNVNFSIKKGEIAFILGDVGSGKTALFQLIQKNYKPSGGHVIVNNTLLDKVNLYSWHKIISNVPQEIKIFNGTVLYNIILDDVLKEGAIDRLHSFCELYGFDRYFSKFPQGYMTNLGEEGLNISGGQKQLVGLARAIYSNPQLLLLDEITSSMDESTERFVLDLLTTLKKTMGLIVISHRVDNTKIADKVYSLNQGELSLI